MTKQNSLRKIFQWITLLITAKLLQEAIMYLTSPYLGSAVATGGAKGGRAPPKDCLCPPHFGSLKLLFLEHHVTERQQQ